MRPDSKEARVSDWVNTNNQMDDIDNPSLDLADRVMNLKPHAQVHLLSPVDKCKVRMAWKQESSAGAECSWCLRCRVQIVQEVQGHTRPRTLEYCTRQWERKTLRTSKNYRMTSK